MGAVPPETVSVLSERVSVSPAGDEGRVGGLGSNNSSIEVHGGNGIKEKGVWEGENMVVIVGTSVMVGMAG